MTQVQDVLELEDRRREPRYQRLLSVNLYDEHDDLVCGNIRLQDMSLHGLCFETIAAQFKPGDRFRFRIDIPERGSIRGTGRVCWCRSADSDVVCFCGAETRSLGLRGRSRLRQYLAPISFSLPRFAGLVVRAIGLIAVGIVAVRWISGDPSFAQDLAIKIDGLLPYFPFAAVALCAAICGLVYFDLDL